MVCHSMFLIEFFLVSCIKLILQESVYDATVLIYEANLALSLPMLSMYIADDCVIFCVNMISSS